MPNNPRHRAVIWTIFWIASGIILVQLIYPPTRAVPTAMLNNQAEGWREEADLAAKITTLFDKTSIELRAGTSEVVTVSLGKLGAQPETAAMVDRLTAYPFWQRYIPLSVFLQPARIETATISYTNPIALEQCRQLAKQLSYPAINARLEIERGRLIATAERPGRLVDPNELCRQIQATAITLGKSTAIVVTGREIAPQRVAADFSAVRSQAERALSRQLEFHYDGQVYQPPSGQIASWLQLNRDEAGQTELVVDRGRVKSYLQTINRQIGHAAGTTSVRIVNGREVSRQVGDSGLVVDYRAAIDGAQAQLLQAAPAEPISLQLVEIAPTIVYNNRYTATEAGLQAYVSDAATDYNAHIMVRQLDGSGWRAAARQNDSIPSASTYKLYVAMWLFDQMEQGKTNWGAPILDTTVSVCFDRMTIASTNPCAEEWLAQAGRENFNQYLYARGVSRGTTFTSPIATHTTAADLTNHMTRLARGELYADVYRQRLYHSLSTHPYRYGIPAGSAGQVYDKVGFLWDYVHDTAIVKHPRGTYVLTIMTKGQSYARIASITREIERIMYP